MNKKFYFSLLATLIFSLLSAPVYADTVVEGHAESHTSVTTNIQGSGEVHTHIESTINGKTKVLDSDKPGTYTLDNSSDTMPTTTISPESSPSASPTAYAKVQQHDEIYFIHEATHAVRTFFHDTVQKLLSIFRL